jgi:adenine-specific DNA-methyltransferase
MPAHDGLNCATAFRIGEQAPTRVLRPHAAGSEFGAAAPASGLQPIRGDDLQALNALLPFHRVGAKCSLIEPPCDTRWACEHDTTTRDTANG